MTIKKLTAMPYAQAHIEIDNDRNTHLFSYVTLVATITNDGWLTVYGLHSMTTRKHISAFMKEYGGGILVKLHHIIADGWSQIMLCNKIGKTYLELLQGKEVKIEISPDYKLHIEEEKEYLASPAFKKDER